MSAAIRREEILDAVQQMPHVAVFEPVIPEIEAARQLIEGSDDLPSALDRLSPQAERALGIYLSGVLQPPAREPEQDSIGDRPDDTGGLAVLARPTLPPSLDEIRQVLIAPPARQIAADVGRSEALAPDGSAAETTFLFLADPQISRAQEPKGKDNPRVKMCSELNQVLNGIGNQVWPSGFGLDPTIVGKPIGASQAVLFGGDMCQTGGDYWLEDQVLRKPASYLGGYNELLWDRYLFDGQLVSNGVTKLSAGPVYFGLGNHDVQSDYTPLVGWGQDCLRWSTPGDYWRWQMWNFICQKHRGVFTDCIVPGATTPIYPPTAMDALAPSSNKVFYWTEKSLSYKVNLGPVDVYQLHVYGGDTENGLASDLDWLQGQLAQSGVARPVIIVQHYDFSNFSIPNWWSPAQRDTLLKALEPYNVIAFLMGHLHNQLNPIPLRQPYPNSAKIADEYRPGSAGEFGYFAVVRVTTSSLNIMQGCGASAKLVWNNGHHKSW